jgi:uncharacterized membrane protein YhaH (DUF805 family)
MSLIGFFLSPSGRISRAPYFFGMFSLNVGLEGFEQAITPGGPPIIRAICLVAFASLLAYSGVALTIKRQHDRNKSGWWYILVVAPGALLFLLLEYSVVLLVEYRIGVYPLIGGIVLAVGLYIFWFIELVLRAGSAETNRYGVVPNGEI